MTENAYIHIPFCRQKCKYCSFISYDEIKYKEQYLQTLSEEIKHSYKNELLKTLYFGGGTPSLLTTDEFKNLILLFKTDNTTEITAELNPENLSQKYLYELKKAGINRISIGCQTFRDDILKNIGRKHTSEQVINVVNMAKTAGFDNISLDFIYGLPEQTTKNFEDDLLKATELGIQHISLYGLKIDEGCYFKKHYPKKLPDDDIQAEMYLKAIEILTQKDFEHYEISNFALKGYYSNHNMNYWNNNSYYGFGIAAHGYINGIRYSNFTNFKDYFANPFETAYKKTLTKKEQLEEEIFLGLRKISGININSINSKYNINFENKYDKIIKKYLDSGHLIKTDNGYKFSENGILLSNYILADFLE